MVPVSGGEEPSEGACRTDLLANSDFASFEFASTSLEILKNRSKKNL